MGKNANILATPRVVKRPAVVPTVKRGGKVAPTTVPMVALAPSDAQLSEWHADAVAAGETYVVLGMSATQTDAVALMLAPVERVKNGEPNGTELCAVSATTDPTQVRLRLVADGTVVMRGREFNAPTAGSAVATVAARAWLLGDSIDNPDTGWHMVELRASGGAYVTASTQTVPFDNGTLQSVTIRVTPGVKEPTAWQAQARVYGGGKVDDSDRTAIIGSALAAGMTRDAATVLADQLTTGPATDAQLATLATPRKRKGVTTQDVADAQHWPAGLKRK